MVSEAEEGPTPRLRDYRLLRGLTQQELAEELERLAWEQGGQHVGVDRGMVSKWERGVKRPSRLYRRLLCSLHGVDEVELGLRPRPRHSSVMRAIPPAIPSSGNGELDEGDDMNRRELLRQAGGLTAAAMMAPWDRLAQALIGPAAIDPAVVEHARKANDRFFGLEEHLPARQLVARS